MANAKTKIIYHCTSCDAQFPKWLGQCSSCGKWGTLEEEVAVSARGDSQSVSIPSAKTLQLSDIVVQKEQRFSSGMSEVDRVLGGGFVAGSLVLLGGDPGVGKSTLTGQMCGEISGTGKGVLYISGEESASQVKMRFDRLGITSDTVAFSSETTVEAIASAIATTSPALAVIDSIQTIASLDVQQEPGSITQVRACTVKLLQAAKTIETTVILVGHVTKDGAVAGPRTLEHLVDVVLYLEGDQSSGYRLLRGAKNRFGSTSEIGVFAMDEKGLSEVSNPSRIFLPTERHSSPGSALTVVLEGVRPFIVEIQALVSRTQFGYPKRTVSGMDLNRVQLLLAVLERKAGIGIGAYDVFVNVVGGYKIKEPAADAAVAVAIASAYKNSAISNDAVVWGEVGLAGEIRRVPHADRRKKEAEQLGFQVLEIEQGKSLTEVLEKMF
ncbi:MAG TPA: DNA repair protein RadA [Patescibacteria group bacterium]|nr:DNA repair protein RadA [Patescibacteria group bacterium]